MIKRANDLLRRVVAHGDIPFDDLARELVVSPRMLGLYLNGKRDIPVTRQLCLAALVIERVPRLARHGHALRGQVDAAIAFEAHATEVHDHSPPRPL